MAPVCVKGIKQASVPPPPGDWVTVEGRFRCISLTCMSSSCPKSPLGLSPSAHLADGTGDLILVWEGNPLGFLKFLYRHTSTQDQVQTQAEAVDSPRLSTQYEFAAVVALRKVCPNSLNIEGYFKCNPKMRFFFF